MKRFVRLVALTALAGCYEAPTPMRIVLPPPAYLSLTGETAWVSPACVDSSALPTHEQLDLIVKEVFLEFGLRAPVAFTDPSCRWLIRLTTDAPSLSGKGQANWNSLEASGAERFAVQTTVVNSLRSQTTIFAATERASLLGLRTTLQFTITQFTHDSQQLQAGTIVDGPGFAYRGIIEGFYGPTYTPEQRSQLIALSGFLRQNTYLYGLKDADPFTHIQWGDPYDDTWSAVVSEAAAQAEHNLMDFIWAVSPGYFGGPEFLAGSIHYGSDTDFQRLVSKTENLRALGVKRFALFVDDIDPELVWPDDAAMFSSLGEAHAYLMNRWDDYLLTTGAPDHLWVVGSKYTNDSSNWLSGSGWEDYNRSLVMNLHPGIQMLWTGPQVYSAAITNGDLQPIEKITDRRMLLWDNWPKTPMPIDNRAPTLNTVAEGLLSNFVMDDYQAPTYSVEDFEQTLGTIADYEWAPRSYDPLEAGWRWRTAMPTVLRRLGSPLGSPN